MKIYKIERKILNESNFPFWYSMLKEAEVLIDFNKVNKIMDFGCGNGSFCKLIQCTFQNANVLGVEIDPTLLEYCKKTIISPRIKFERYNEITASNLDVVFSQEVVYTQASLIDHATEVFGWLKKGGYYIFTVGCHIENPSWPMRRNKIRSTENYYAFDYSLEDIAKAFYDVGFRVTVKKLPVHVPIKYVPSRHSEFSSITEMLDSCEEYKVIFAMLKPKYE